MSVCLSLCVCLSFSRAADPARSSAGFLHSTQPDLPRLSRWRQVTSQEASRNYRTPLNNQTDGGTFPFPRKLQGELEMKPPTFADVLPEREARNGAPLNA